MDVLARVEERLAALGLSASAASMRAGLNVDAIRNLRRASVDTTRKGISSRTAAALAPVLHTSVGWLLNGEGEAEVSQLTVPLVGYIGAGDAAHFYGEDQGELDRIEADDAGGISAREIRGRSMGRMLEGWLVFTGERQRSVPDAYLGKICEVALSDGRVLVKQVRRAKLPGVFHLYSETEEPMLDEEVEWSAVVTSMRPR